MIRAPFANVGFLCGLAAATLVAATPALAQPAGGAERTRARTQLRVTPPYPYRGQHSFYPLPYDVEYPGPRARRDCVDAYVTEHRPSGTVLVPRMRCRWIRG